jgi:hypothetical protein
VFPVANAFVDLRRHGVERETGDAQEIRAARRGGREHESHAK